MEARRRHRNRALEVIALLPIIERDLGLRSTGSAIGLGRPTAGPACQPQQPSLTCGLTTIVLKPGGSKLAL